MSTAVSASPSAWAYIVYQATEFCKQQMPIIFQMCSAYVQMIERVLRNSCERGWRIVPAAVNILRHVTQKMNNSCPVYAVAAVSLKQSNVNPKSLILQESMVYNYSITLTLGTEKVIWGCMAIPPCRLIYVSLPNLTYPSTCPLFN